MSFLKQTFSDYKHTGAIAASSKNLARLFIKTGGIQNKKVVVEFGPGTGVFTEEILKAMPEGGTYFGLELNESFVERTRLRCPDATIHHDSATNIKKYLEELGLTHCDCIISGLPFANFEEGLQNEILQSAADALRPSGEFLTFAYTVGLLTKKGKKFKKKLPQFFETVTRTRTVMGNLPPAFIYHAVKAG